MRNRFEFLSVFLLTLTALLLQGAVSPARGDDLTAEDVVRNLQSRFAEIEDYTVLLSVESDIEAFRVPRMEVKAFFKQPDRLHLESKGFAILPKEGIFINPNLFTNEDFYMAMLGKETLKGRELLKLELVPRKEGIKVRKLVLWIDQVRWITLKIEIVTWQGQSFQVDLEYKKFQDRYWMPVKATAMVDFSGFRGFSSFHGGSGWETPDRAGSDKMKGEITVRFDDYRINEGIPDSIFGQGEGGKGP